MSTPTITTVPTEQFADLARRGQDAATTAAQATTRAWQGYAEVVANGPRPVDPQLATTAAFDLAAQLLHVQRDYVGTAVALLTEAGETVTAHASVTGETLKANAEAATERVIDLATEATRRTAGTGVSA